LGPLSRRFDFLVFNPNPGSISDRDFSGKPAGSRVGKSLEALGPDSWAMRENASPPGAFNPEVFP
jgi:hypothetical protein